MKKEIFLQKIDLFIEGELSEKERKEIEEFLQDYPEYIEEVEKYRRLLKLTRAVAKVTPKPPPDLEQKIVAAIITSGKNKNQLSIWHVLIPALTFAVILSIIYLPAFLNLTGKTNVIAVQQYKAAGKATFFSNKDVSKNTVAISFSPSTSAIQTAKEEFKLFVNHNTSAPLNKSSYTYIIPITSSASWKKLAKYLKQFQAGYKVAIKPIIKDKKQVNYDEIMANLQQVKYSNPSVRIEDISYSPTGMMNANSGIVLQISVQR